MNFLHVIQTGSGAHPASYPMDTVGSFHGVKRPELEADRSRPTSGEVKKMWIYTSTPPYTFMVQHSDNFTLTFTRRDTPEDRTLENRHCTQLRTEFHDVT
jgi:hypothetical protein